MQLLNKSLQPLSRSITGSRQENTAIYTWQPTLGESICPCCSYTLLRHIGLRGIYWRCSHCYQEMPLYQARGIISLMHKKNAIQSPELQQIITQSEALSNKPKLLEPQQQPIIRLNTFG